MLDLASSNPEIPKSVRQLFVKAVTNFNDHKMLAELSEDLGEAMVGINEQEIALLMAEGANKMKIAVLAVQGAFIEHEKNWRPWGQNVLNSVRRKT